MDLDLEDVLIILGIVIGVAIYIGEHIWFRNTLIRCMEIAIRRSRKDYTYYKFRSGVMDKKENEKYKEIGGTNYHIETFLSDELEYLETGKIKRLFSDKAIDFFAGVKEENKSSEESVDRTLNTSDFCSPRKIKEDNIEKEKKNEMS